MLYDLQPTNSCDPFNIKLLSVCHRWDDWSPHRLIWLSFYPRGENECAKIHYNECRSRSNRLWINQLSCNTSSHLHAMTYITIDFHGHDSYDGARTFQLNIEKIQNFYRRWRNDCNQNNICFNFCLRPDSYGWYFDSPLTSGYWWHPIISNDWCLGTLSQGNFSHRFFRLCHFARGTHTTHIICIESYITFFDMLLAQKKNNLLPGTAHTMITFWYVSFWSEVFREKEIRGCDIMFIFRCNNLMALHEILVNDAR